MNLTNNTPQAILLLNCNYEIISCNKVAMQVLVSLFERTVAINEIFTRLLPEAEAIKFISACEKALAGADSSIDCSIAQKNGGTRAAVFNISCFMKSGFRQDEFLLTIEVGANFLNANTRSGQYEKLINTIFNTADIGIALVDSGDNFLKVNEGLCTLLGFTREELMGKPYHKVVAPADREEVKRLRPQFLSGKNDTMERLLMRKDGRTICCYITNNLFVDDNGNKFLLKTIHNVSASMKYKELLMQTARLTKTAGFEMDIASNDITFTPEMYDIYELPHGEKPTVELVRSLYDEETREMTKRTVDKAILTGERYDMEYKLITRNKNEKWVRVIGTPVVEKGKVVKLAGTVQDITTEKKLELQLQRLSLVASKTNNAVIITDAFGKIEWVNDSFVELTGYEMAEVLGKKPGLLLQGPGTEITSVNRMSSQLAKHLPVSEVVKNYRKDGTAFWINMSITPVFKNNKLINFIGLGIDITEILDAREARKEKESLEHQLQLFNAIAKNFPDGIIGVLDKDFNYVYVGGTEIERLGLDPETLIGEHIFDSLYEEGNMRAEPFFKRAFAGENVLFEMDIRQHTYLINAVPMQSGKDMGNQILIVLYNITKRKKVEEEVRIALAKQSELNEMKSKFVSIASHEFRTPLSVILSSTDLLYKYAGLNQEEKVNRHIDRIRQSVSALTDMLNDFLSLEKIEEGKVAANITTFNITEFCESLVDEIKLTLKKGQLVIYKHIGEDVNISLDQQKLKHVLTNIIGNAAKYSGEGKRIWLTSYTSGEMIRFVITDEGIGIPAEDQPHLFQTFFRANNAVNIQGTGMGLHIVKRFLDIMGGKIEFTSKLNEGSTFTTWFPSK